MSVIMEIRRQNLTAFQGHSRSLEPTRIDQLYLRLPVSNL